MNDGILILDKPAGMTSREVDNAVGKLFHTRHVGHLGTLDPFATGLLIVSVEKGGKFLPFLGGGNKTYIAELVLGTKTSTGDPEGEVIETEEVPSLSRPAIESALNEFLGKGEQIPPMTSAIKVNGTALYELAHQGIEIERKPRAIEIFSLFCMTFENNVLTFVAEVSEGTYIRVLGEDIAKALGTVGYLKSLRRVKVGNFSIEEAVELPSVTTSSLLDPTPYVRLKHVELDEANAKKAKNGMALPLSSDEERVLLVQNGKAIAVYEKSGNVYRSLRGLF